MVARLQCLARLVRLDDLSFQPSITCKMRKKSSGSFTSLCAGFGGTLWKFFVNLLRFEFICGSFRISVEVFVYLWKFLVYLWKF